MLSKTKPNGGRWRRHHLVFGSSGTIKAVNVRYNVADLDGGGIANPRYVRKMPALDIVDDPITRRHHRGSSPMSATVMAAAF